MMMEIEILGESQMTAIVLEAQKELRRGKAGGATALLRVQCHLVNTAI